MAVEEVTEVFQHLQLQVFMPQPESVLSQLLPDACCETLTWTKLSTIHFVSMQVMVDMIGKVRKKVVTNLNESVLGAISSAVEEIRIPSGNLFSKTRRFPEGLYVAWIPAHPMIQSLCYLQKLCVSNVLQHPLVGAKLLAVLDNVENYLCALDLQKLGVYDRDKFERTVAQWKFNWSTLSYQYEIIENEPLRRS